MVNYDARFAVEVPSEAVESIDDVYAQEAFWETGGGSSFSTTDRLVISMAPQRLPTGTHFADLVWALVDYLELLGKTASDAVEKAV